MIVVNVWVDSDCSFDQREYKLDFVAAVNDTLDLHEDPLRICDCLEEGLHGVWPETLYQVNLSRASFDSAVSGGDRGFVIAGVERIDVNNGHVQPKVVNL